MKNVDPNTTMIDMTAELNLRIESFDHQLKELLNHRLDTLRESFGLISGQKSCPETFTNADAEKFIATNDTEVAAVAIVMSTVLQKICSAMPQSTLRAVAQAVNHRLRYEASIPIPQISPVVTFDPKDFKKD